MRGRWAGQRHFLLILQDALGVGVRECLDDAVHGADVSFSSAGDDIGFDGIRWESHTMMLNELEGNMTKTTTHLH